MAKELNQKPLSNLEIAEFCNQMHILLSSGISSTESLVLLAEDSQSDAENKLLTHMIEDIELSGSLYEAAVNSNVFPDYALHMIKLGEETGTLDETMYGLSNHYTREQNITNMIKSSLIYPSIMLGMMFLIILVLLTQILPIFNQVFQQLGQELSGFSAGLLIIGETLSKYSVAFMITAVLLIIILYFNRNRLPFQKKISENIAACRFSGGMSIALKSGLTPDSALDLSINLVNHPDFITRLSKCKSQIEDGSSLSDALQENLILKGSYARMARIAEKAGTLDETMAHISSEYEHDVNNYITRHIAMLEPTLVIIMSLIVGIILFSVMLPLLGIMSGL